MTGTAGEQFRRPPILSVVGLELGILTLIPGLGNVADARRLTYADSHMKYILLTLLHLAVVAANSVAPVAYAR